MHLKAIINKFKKIIIDKLLNIRKLVYIVHYLLEKFRGSRLWTSSVEASGLDFPMGPNLYQGDFSKTCFFKMRFLEAPYHFQQGVIDGS